MSENKQGQIKTNVSTPEFEDSNKEKQVIIIAPHPDDEIIGCYNVLKNNPSIMIYTSDISQERKEEALKLKDHVDIKGQFFLKTIPTHFFNDKYKFYFPNIDYEVHPEHRQNGFIGEQLARSGFDVTFYSTIMNTPYIYEINDSEGKRDLLEKVYPSQKDLWKYDYKYFLFEGYCKWVYEGI